MLISGYQLDLSTAHARVASRTQRQSLQRWVGERPGARPAPPAPPPVSVTVTAPAGATCATCADGGEADPAYDKTLRLLQLMFGLKPQRQFSLHIDQRAANAVAQAAGAAGRAQQAQPARAGWGLDYQSTTTVSDWERTSLAASGTVATADGRSISLSFTYELERRYESTSTVSVRAGDAAAPVDPLVLDLGGGGLSFSAQTMAIDLDRDGSAETVHRPGAGNAFLAYDADGNGAIDHGGEIFGPTTGQGFAELARLDQDGNGAIDEGDAAWNSLRLWDGSGAPMALSSAGVGAILLPSLAAGFTHTDADNQALAYTRRLGVYLREDGSAGAVSQVDLVA